MSLIVYTKIKCHDIYVEFQGEPAWVHCTLCRSGRQSVSTLNKALTRKVEWPTTPNTASFYSSEVQTLTLCSVHQ